MAKNKLFTKAQMDLFGKDVVKILTIFLKKGRPPWGAYKATGALINSIDYKLKEEAEAILIAIESNDYLKYVDEGRRPGTGEWGKKPKGLPNISAISKWAGLKGIPQTAVWPIVYSIWKRGIEPSDVIDKTIEEIETSGTLSSKLEDAMVENVEDFIMFGFERRKKGGMNLE